MELERSRKGQKRNYWWKKLTVVHEQIAEAYENIINDAREIDIEWLVMGETELIPKEGDWSAANQRPITLLNTCYKWLTSVLKEKMEKHLAKFDMLQCDQRGGRRDTWGVMDNLLIDGMILEECRIRNKNLNCTWVDVAKAYDSVSHKWLLKTLELHKIPTAIANTIIKLSKQWKTRLRVKTQAGVVLTEPIQFKRGLYQGDTLCLLHFIICVNPMSWKLRTLPRYRPTKPLNINISHGLFIDNLKLYSSSERQHGIQLALSHQMMEDMGLSMAAKKTQTISMARGKRVEKDVGLKLSEDVTIEDLGDRLYKFLEVEEAEQHENKVVLKKAEKEVIRRVSVILDTPMSDQNKINAINTLGLPVLTFFIPVIFFSQEDLNEADLKVKRLLTERGARRPQHLNTLLYASRSIGGRGLKQISSGYKETKIKAALRLATSNDSRLQAVAQFQQIKENKGRRSIFKDARGHGMDMALDLELGEDKPTLSMKTTEGRTYTASDPAGAKKVIAKGRIEK